MGRFLEARGNSPASLVSKDADRRGFSILLLLDLLPRGEQMGSLTPYQAFDPSRAGCPSQRPAARFISISCSPEIHHSFTSSAFSSLQKIWILGCKDLQSYNSVLIYKSFLLSPRLLKATYVKPQGPLPIFTALRQIKS